MGKPKLLSSVYCTADFRKDKCLFDDPEYQNMPPFESVCQHCPHVAFDITKLGERIQTKQDKFGKQAKQDKFDKEHKDAPLVVRTIKSVEDIEKLAEDMGEIIDEYPIGCAV